MSKLNPDQQRAADYTHTSPAVVTAAAGSGKTTLLVERVIRLLSDRELDIKADTLCVMTFTRNATKSLREKLNRALSDRLEELSDDNSEEAFGEREYLNEQIFALRSASISTIDAFCLKMLRENAEAFDLPISFTIADAAKKTALQSQAMKLAMQDMYDEMLTGDRAFSKEERETLFYTFDFENDYALEKNIMSTAEELSTYADAEGWLSGAESVYESIESLENEYIKPIKDLLSGKVKRARHIAELYGDVRNNLVPEIREILDGLEPNARNRSRIDSANKLLNEIAPTIFDYIDEDFRRLGIIEAGFKAFEDDPSLETLSGFFAEVKSVEENPVSVDPRSGAKTVYRRLFTNAKNAFKEVVADILGYSVDKAAEEEAFPRQRTAVRSFVKLLRVYGEYLAELKRSSGCVDFSDCELILLEKLRSDDDFRRQLSERFGCIIVDEFQDVNDIQAEIFKLLGNGRLFYVGDVKQSIYAFRGGNPYIMARLAEREGFRELPLNVNYRSRRAVIDTVNAAFSGLMTEEYGGADYARGHQLRLGADYPEIPEECREKYVSEVILLDTKDSADDDKDMAQARFVAAKIKALHDDEGFLISKENGLERCGYSDFAVLLRTKSKIPLYRRALEELGIASSAPKGRNFLDAEEITLVINYLKIIDNPLKNEEMLKVLMSPIYRFTAEEAAQLRLGTLGVAGDALTEKQARSVAKACKKYSLYNCIRVCSQPLDLGELTENETGIAERAVNPKLKRFAEDLSSFRYCSSSGSLNDLIRKVYEDTEITSVVAAFEDSAQRVSNVRALQRLASDFTARDGGDLSDFLRFIDRARENAQGGVEEAARPESAADTVRIMTFHGSKGLEVPVCIMAELQTAMNLSDFSGTLLVNRDKYLALKSVDVKKRLRTKTLAYNSVSRFIRKKLCGEELRLLYVAMTRAREKLIMVGKFDLSDPDGSKFDPNIPEEIFDKTAPFKWVLGSLLRYAPEDMPDSFALDGVDCRIHREKADGVAPSVEAAEEERYEISDGEAEELVSLMNERYAYAEETRQQAKFTVTELAHQQSVRPVNLIKPSFASGGKPSGTEKGNAYHHAMQFISLDSLGDCSERAVSAAIAELVESGKLTEREAEIAEPAHIAEFFRGELGQRMLKSLEIRREQPFYAEICGREVGQDYDGRISVQGQIDLYFVEEDGIVVVDYKSDTVTNLEEERENYAKQVKIYSKILPEFTGKPIKEMYLYAFLADKAYKI
ncbi:MAG: UvrD-helicase domain-containing protein [Lachnospiraceae bacterium]|nr:UvrD-helicase domain-containing protein [Ruminococcus sp.]MCM1274583.1 UvrD-helicase domain-containing protein [Lachnospiraceae bacterium]